MNDTNKQVRIPKWLKYGTPAVILILAVMYYTTEENWDNALSLLFAFVLYLAWLYLGGAMLTSTILTGQNKSKAGKQNNSPEVVNKALEQKVPPEESAWKRFLARITGENIDHLK